MHVPGDRKVSREGSDEWRVETLDVTTLITIVCDKNVFSIVCSRPKICILCVGALCPDSSFV